MITPLQAIDLLYQYLSPSTLKNAITGDIYKNEYPVNSVLEDVVINALPFNNADLQTGIANVNIYVPNLNLNFGGVVDNSQPNFARLDALATIATGLLWRYHAPGYNFEIQQSSLLKDENVQKHYVNIRINFRSVNIKTLN